MTRGVSEERSEIDGTHTPKRQARRRARGGGGDWRGGWLSAGGCRGERFAGRRDGAGRGGRM